VSSAREKRKEHAFWHQFDKKPSIIPGRPDSACNTTHECHFDYHWLSRSSKTTKGKNQRNSGACMQVWHHALQFTAEVMLEGLARAGAKSRCTMMGRAAMSLDLQVRS